MKLTFEICMPLILSLLKKSKHVQLCKYETDPYFPQIFQSKTSVCLIISVFCKSFEPICEPEIVLKIFAADFQVGLDRTWHMSLMTGQDWTPEFARQILPDRTESGLIFNGLLIFK